MAIRVYGIPNCNTVKKARTWLDQQGIAYEFVDFKKQIPSTEKLSSWLQIVSVDSLLNKKGTTWRGLSSDEQARANHIDGAKQLMNMKPSLIKRPVLERDGVLLLGFDEHQYADFFK